MSFWNHLEVFRWVLIRFVIVLLIITVALFSFMPTIYDIIIMAPTRSDFFLYKYLCILSSSVPFLPDFCENNFEINIINVQLTSQFFRHVSTSIWLALILIFPYLIFEIWHFIKPGLHTNEKKNMKYISIFSSIMFFIGCLLGYSIIFPVTLRFLADYQLSETIVNLISLDSYMDNFIMLIFMMGIVFELPVVSWILSQLGMLEKSFFKKYRRYAIVALLILSAFITPTGDPLSLFMVFIPLYLLFEVSRCFCSE